MNFRAELDQRITAALCAAGAENAQAIVNPSSKPQFGDYQANGCMAAAKAMKMNPRELAEKVVENLDIADLAEKVEIAGPGFLNIFLHKDFLVNQLKTVSVEERLGCEPQTDPQPVVVDYSAPNLAKEMHVGHLRSTIIGDALARVLQFLGREVIRQNHVGDWGTQFGMLVAYLKETQAEGAHAADAELSDLETFYRHAKQKFDEEPAFAEKARAEVVGFQSGDPEALELLKKFLAISMQHCQAVYDALGVLLTPNDVRGESSYNDDLPRVVADLNAKGLLAESQGAKGVYLEEFRNKENEPAFVIVQKSDGGYLYATTDLAAMRYRNNNLHADRVLYVTDSRQALHFAEVFTIARKADFVSPEMSLEHVPFGMMMGDDGKPFKTRTGGTVKLMDLIEEAIQRAAALVAEKNPDMPSEQREQIARVVGVGALKYGDLAQNRTSDYIFSWNKMLAMEGNTAPYMQYAYARVRSIFRKGQADGAEIDPDGFMIEEPAERTLAVKLLQFSETVASVAETTLPNILCAYLFDLAGAFMSFYEQCPVLKADEPIKTSRLALCDLTSRIIKTGLSLLGIDTLEQM